MTSYYWAVADAGGNIYPFSFGKTKVDAQCNYIYRNFVGSIPFYAFKNPTAAYEDLEFTDAEWQLRTRQGDHLVQCRVEWLELVEVTPCDQNKPNNTN